MMNRSDFTYGVLMFFISVGLFIALSIGPSIEASAQNRGYIGKRHEVSIDLIEAAYEPSVHVNYKYALLRHFGLVLEYGWQNYDLANYTGHTYGLGMLVNSQNPQMEIPIGYYAGMMYTFNNGDYRELKPNDALVDYENIGRAVKIFIGKDTALSPSFSLDMNIEVGYKWGYMFSEEDEEIIPLSIYPRDNYFSNPSRFKEDMREIDSMERMVHTYARFLVMPRIKLGFMF